MKKIWIAVIIAAVLAIGVGVWYFVIKDDSLEVSTSNIDTRTTDDLEESDSINGTWIVQLQDDVFIGYEIEELFGSDTVKKTAVGKSQAVSGTLVIEDDVLTEGNITVDMTQLQSDSSSRDSKMENEGLETNDFSEAKFVANANQSLKDSVTKNKDVEVNISGKLTLHGVTKDISLKLTANWNGKVIVLSGEHEIQLSDYEISPPDTPFVKVDDKGSIKFQLLFFPQEN